MSQGREGRQRAEKPRPSEGNSPRLEGFGLRGLPRSGRGLTSPCSESPAVRTPGAVNQPRCRNRQLTAALFLQPEDQLRQIRPHLFLFPGTPCKIPRSKCPLFP